jgi:CHAT domain-containing protein
VSRLFLAGDCLLAHDVIYRRDPLEPGCVVVLSACQTGIKDRRAVDEGLGLMTAFLLRGAGLVLATQWNVADHFAARTVDAFARELVAGSLPTEALRRALAATRGLSPTDVSADCDVVLSRYAGGQFPHETAQVLNVQAVAEAAAGHHTRARELRDRARALSSTTGLTRSRGAGGPATGYNDPFVWAVFQLTGRVV